MESAEDKRGIAEQRSDEELVIFDLLTKPEISLNEKEAADVKKVANPDDFSRYTAVTATHNARHFERIPGLQVHKV